MTRRISLSNILIVAMVAILGPGIVDTVDKANRTFGSAVGHYQQLSAQGAQYTPSVYRR